jgi:hypothetical protein
VKISDEKLGGASQDFRELWNAENYNILSFFLSRDLIFRAFSVAFYPLQLFNQIKFVA